MTTGEQRLIAAVIRQGIADAVSGDESARQEALGWLESASGPMLAAVAPPGISGQQLRTLIAKRLGKPKSAKRLAELIGEKAVKAPRQHGHQPATRPTRNPCSSCGRLSISPVCFMCQLGQA
jgi:hypothetical protein